MWVKKTKSEFLNDKCKQRRRDLKAAIAYWIGFALLLGILPPRKIGGEFLWKLSPLVATRRLLVCFVIVGIGIYLWFWRPRVRRTKPASLICPKCEAVKAPEGQIHCACGGEFVDLSEMKWVEAEKAVQ